MFYAEIYKICAANVHNLCQPITVELTKGKGKFIKIEWAPGRNTWTVADTKKIERIQ